MFLDGNKKKNGRIIVAMSGGVDSSVVAYLLKQQGNEVVGLFMKNWEEDDDDQYCHAEEDWDDVVAVCEQIGIPCYSVNFAKEYWDEVFAQCLKEYEQGLTPNPDVLCNRQIKFKHLLNKAKELGGQYLATGHYCRVEQQGENFLLKTGKDPDKDQSYFLYTIQQEALSQVLFPLGDMHKSEVRALAEEAGLATSKKKDSTGICFIGKRKFKDFISRFIQKQPGQMVTPDGEVIGSHEGLAFYTIGQRQGLGIGGPGEAWFVAGKDQERNELIVVQGGDHPALLKTKIQASEFSWVSGQPPGPLPFSCQARIRYRQSSQACTIMSIENGVAQVHFDQPQRAVTPRQSIVFYNTATCLGGAMIGDSE